MILLDLKQYFKEHHKASDLEVAKHYGIQLSAAQGMIDFWVSRGSLKACDRLCSKGSCNGCSLAVKQFQYVG